MDSIQTTQKGISSVGNVSHDIWMYIAFAEFVIVVALCLYILFRRRTESERSRTKSKILREGEIDFGNVIDSSFKAKALYDELKKVCHPDKFPKDEELNARATEIFSLLVKHKHDYAALCKLKERAANELGLKF